MHLFAHQWLDDVVYREHIQYKHAALEEDYVNSRKTDLRWAQTPFPEEALLYCSTAAGWLLAS